MLSPIMLNVIMLGVVMLRVVTAFTGNNLKRFEQSFENAQQLEGFFQHNLHLYSANCLMFLHA
jgi:hypothetical protein